MRSSRQADPLGMPADPPGPAPIVAVVGRPNVGKSTLVNRLARRRVAIVADEPGMTRDRVYAKARLRDRPAILVDTGGFDIDPASPLVEAIREQLMVAVEEADVIVCLFDGASPPSALDVEVVARLRRSARPVLYVANKTEGRAAKQVALEYHELGIEHILPVSAAQGDGIGELVDAILDLLPIPDAPGNDAPAASDGIRLAIMGRPNAGKSTLVNTLLGQERMIVDAEPGTTRDAVQHRLERAGKRYVLIDTAGMRRPRSIGRITEELAVLHAVKAMTLADVVLLLVDVSAEISDQDLRIANLAIKRGRGLVVCLNKWDMPAEKPDLVLARPFTNVGTLEYIPVLRLSGKEGWNLDEVFSTVERVAAARSRRLSTSELNRFLELALRDHQPPAVNRRPLTLKYITQVADAPPTFAVFCNHPEGVTAPFRRFLENRMRQTWDFTGVPIRLSFRAKGRNRKRPDR